MKLVEGILLLRFLPSGFVFSKLVSLSLCLSLLWKEGERSSDLRTSIPWIGLDWQVHLTHSTHQLALQHLLHMWCSVAQSAKYAIDGDLLIMLRELRILRLLK